MFKLTRCEAGVPQRTNGQTKTAYVETSHAFLSPADCRGPGRRPGAEGGDRTDFILYRISRQKAKVYVIFFREIKNFSYPPVGAAEEQPYSGKKKLEPLRGLRYNKL